LRTAAERVKAIMFISNQVLDEYKVSDSERARICEMAAKLATDPASPLFKSYVDAEYERDFRGFVKTHVHYTRPAYA
jgi:hypothetical protein